MCRLTILKSKVTSAEKWEVDLCAIQSKLEKEICNWKAKYENLEEEEEKLAEEMLSEIKKDYGSEKERTRKLDIENQQLTKDIARLQNENLGIHRGAGIPDLKTKKKTNTNRKLKELKTRAQKTLNLLETIGLYLQLLKLKDLNSTDGFSVDFSTTNPPNP